jgi:hypothetical protein
MIKLLYLSDIAHLEDVWVKNPHLLRQNQTLTGDMIVAFELERLGFDFIDEWDLINSDEINKNLDDSYILANNWWDEHIYSTEYEGLALTEAATIDLSYSFQASLNARTIYSRLFDKYSINIISGYFSPSFGMTRSYSTAASISQAVFQYIAKQRGVIIDKLNV